jgi:hypothetical protein
VPEIVIVLAKLQGSENYHHYWHPASGCSSHLTSRAAGWQFCWEGFVQKKTSNHPRRRALQQSLRSNASPQPTFESHPETPVRSGHADIVDLTGVEEEEEIDERAAPDRSVTTENPRAPRPGGPASRDVHRPLRRREPHVSPALMGTGEGGQGTTHRTERHYKRSARYNGISVHGD